VRQVSFLRAMAGLFAGVGDVIREEAKLMRDERTARSGALRPAPAPVASAASPGATPHAAAPTGAHLDPEIASLNASLKEMDAHLDATRLDLERPEDISLGGPAAPAAPSPKSAEPAKAPRIRSSDPAVAALEDALEDDPELDGNGGGPAGMMSGGSGLGGLSAIAPIIERRKKLAEQMAANEKAGAEPAAPPIAPEEPAAPKRRKRAKKTIVAPQRSPIVVAGKTFGSDALKAPVDEEGLGP
jgi:hypothetical protein